MKFPWNKIFFHRLREASMKGKWLPWKEIIGNFHGSKSNERRLTLTEVLWNQLGVCDTRGSRWKYVGVYGSSWKLPRNRFVEAAINGSNGSFHFHWQWKLQCTPMKASTNCHGSKNTSTNFHRISLEVNLLPPISMEVFMKINRLPWKWFTSTEPWKCGNFYASRSNGSRWTLMEVMWKQLEILILTEVGGSM